MGSDANDIGAYKQDTIQMKWRDSSLFIKRMETSRIMEIVMG